MDLNVLKKRISSYRTDGGHLRDVSDDVVLEILSAWEQWTGPASGFYRAIDVDFRKVGSLIKKGKKLKREGHSANADFIEITPSEVTPPSGSDFDSRIELALEKGKLLRFSQVDTLMEFLKKSA